MKTFRERLADNAQDFDNIVSDILLKIDVLEHELKLKRETLSIVEKFLLPKHGELWERLPSTCHPCGWSLGAGIHVIDATKNYAWGTLEQVCCGCLRKV